MAPLSTQVAGDRHCKQVRTKDFHGFAHLPLQLSQTLTLRRASHALLSRDCASCSGEAENAEVLAEAAALGLGQPVAISASHGEGMPDLYEAMQETIDALSESRMDTATEAELSGDSFSLMRTTAQTGLRQSPSPWLPSLHSAPVTPTNLICSVGMLAAEMEGDVGDLKAHPLKLAVVGLPNVVMALSSSGFGKPCWLSISCREECSEAFSP